MIIYREKEGQLAPRAPDVYKDKRASPEGLLAQAAAEAARSAVRLIHAPTSSLFLLSWPKNLLLLLFLAMTCDEEEEEFWERFRGLRNKTKKKKNGWEATL